MGRRWRVLEEGKDGVVARVARPRGLVGVLVLLGAVVQNVERLMDNELAVSLWADAATLTLLEQLPQTHRPHNRQ